MNELSENKNKLSKKYKKESKRKKDNKKTRVKRKKNGKITKKIEKRRKRRKEGKSGRGSQRRKHSVINKRQRGGSATLYYPPGGWDIRRSPFPSVIIRDLSKWFWSTEEWMVLKIGNENIGNLKNIRFEIQADSSELGSGAYGDVVEAKVASLIENIPGAGIESGIVGGKSYAIKISKQGKRIEIHKKLISGFDNEFEIMKTIFNMVPKNLSHLFVRPFLLLSKGPVISVRSERLEDRAIVMELCKPISGAPYSSLSYHIQKQNMALSSIKRNVKDIALSIATMHSLGYAHHDIKSVNILLVEMFEGDTEGQVKLIDFGTAYNLDANDPLGCCKEDLTGMTELFLEPYVYMDDKPGGLELLSKQRTVGSATDWWAFGILILELLNYIPSSPPGLGGAISKRYKEEHLEFERIQKGFTDTTFTINLDRFAEEIKKNLKRRCENDDELTILKELLRLALYFLVFDRNQRPTLYLEGDKLMSRTPPSVIYEDLQRLIEWLNEG